MLIILWLLILLLLWLLIPHPSLFLIVPSSMAHLHFFSRIIFQISESCIALSL